jgi:hypothetical protein
VAQDWGHHTFSGGCIDLMRQGVHQDPTLNIHQYDISSAYPAQIAQLPSMFGGEYKFHKAASLKARACSESFSPEGKKEKLEGRKDKSLSSLKVFVEASNMLSMFEIEWDFKTYIDQKEAETHGLPFRETGRELTVKYDWEAAPRKQCESEPPFYPLFYRTNGSRAGADKYSGAPEHDALCAASTNDGANLILYPPHRR